MPLPLLFLPGLMCDARLFAPQVAALSHQGAVMVGHYGSAARVEGMAAHILEQAPARFALAGLSMGGIVAMEVVAQAPERVAGLALMDTNAGPEGPSARAFREDAMAQAAEGALASVMTARLLPKYVADPIRDRATLDLCLAMALEFGPEVFARQCAALIHRPDQRPRLGAYGGPSVILWGAQDALCPTRYHAEIAELLPQAHLAEIPAAGHLPVLEAPEAVTPALAAWWARCV